MTEQRAEQPDEPQIIAAISVLFTADGGMQLNVQGAKANNFWAAGEMLRNMGDDLWSESRAEAKRQAAAKNASRKIVTLDDFR